MPARRKLKSWSFQKRQLGIRPVGRSVGQVIDSVVHEVDSFPAPNVPGGRDGEGKVAAAVTKAKLENGFFSSIFRKYFQCFLPFYRSVFSIFVRAFASSLVAFNAVKEIFNHPSQSSRFLLHCLFKNSDYQSTFSPIGSL